MNTPTHIMLSIALLTRDGRKVPDHRCDTPATTSDLGENGLRQSYLVPAIVGAIIPDAAMFVFYPIEKGWIGSTEQEIWNTRYFLPAWQDLFDVFNSFPLVIIGLLLASCLGRPGWIVLFASVLLHLVCDLPLHHDDGHRHFWPLLQWRFESPVSYWDPRHFGKIAGSLELLLFVACYDVSLRKHASTGVRVGLTLLAVTHFSVMSLAFWWFSGI